MTQHYSNPERANDPNALPDIETFYRSAGAAAVIENLNDPLGQWTTEECEHLAGWYWQSCFPGCLPDGEPNGPFDSEDEAVKDARSGYLDDTNTSVDCSIGEHVNCLFGNLCDCPCHGENGDGVDWSRREEEEG
jgi:hypothetical protein